MIAKSWFLYLFAAVTNYNYTNKCQLVTVLLGLLLSSSQVEQSTTGLPGQDTWEMQPM